MDVADTVADEASAFADLLEALPTGGRRAPTPCADWTIDDLARHVATGLFGAAEAFHRARLGTLTPPAEIALAVTQPGQIRLGAHHLRDALAHGPARWPDIPLRFGRYPVTVALQCLVIEYGVHHNDLARACVDPDAPFTPATVDTLFGFGEQYLLLQAAPIAAAPAAFIITTPSITMAITWDGQHWRAGGDPSTPRCAIHASDDDAARLMLRRLDIAALGQDDPAGLAPLFAAAIRPL